MAKLKIVIGNVDIQSDDPQVAGNVIRNLVNGLLSIELEPAAETPEPRPKRLTSRKTDGG